MSIFENTVLVDKKVSVVNVILRYLCIALAIFCVLVSIIVYPGILLVPAIIFAVFWYLLKIASQIEWEYTYIEGRLSFARIKAKRKRKNVAKIEMEEVVLIAPSTAHELYNYHNNNQVSVKDCSSKQSGAKTYEVIYKNGSGLGDIAIRYGYYRYQTAGYDLQPECKESHQIGEVILWQSREIVIPV